MDRAKVATYLFDRIKAEGVDLTFGIPGDYVLPLYAHQERCSLKTVVMTHEPSVGFAADAYARLKGLGVALVTYGAGGLNMVNSVACAYAEESPLLVLSGSPDTRFLSQPAELHHCVRGFDSQAKVMAEVTASSTSIDNPLNAQTEIDRVLNTTIKHSRPGYIELPRDVLNMEIDVKASMPETIATDSPAMSEAVVEIIQRLSSAKQAVVLAGAHIRRFQAHNKVLTLVSNLNIPVVTSILGKSSFPESHHCFIGNYLGKFGAPQIREYVESCDLILCLGAVLTEMETGGYTATLPAEKLIVANAHELKIARHSFGQIDFLELIDQLLKSTTSGALKDKRFATPVLSYEALDLTPKISSLSVGAMLTILNNMIDDTFIIVTDTGDCMYAGLSLKTDSFIAPGYYSTMGFGVPAGIGAQLADPKRRSLILVGDGGFQMTGCELSTAARLGLNPIIILFDNASYAMMRFIDKEREYYKLPRWDYVSFAKSLGAIGMQAKTKVEFGQALKNARCCDQPVLIDCLIAENDISPTLKRLTDHFGQKLRAAAS